MQYKLQSNIFPLLNAYVVKKYNSTLKSFTVLLTPGSLCSGLGLLSWCPGQIENWPHWVSDFQIPWCASLHRISTQVISTFYFTPPFLLAACHVDVGPCKRVQTSAPKQGLQKVWLIPWSSFLIQDFNLTGTPRLFPNLKFCRECLEFENLNIFMSVHAKNDTGLHRNLILLSSQHWTYLSLLVLCIPHAPVSAPLAKTINLLGAGLGGASILFPFIVWTKLLRIHTKLLSELVKLNHWLDTYTYFFDKCSHFKHKVNYTL